MLNLRFFFLFGIAVGLNSTCFAFKNQVFSVGVGYFAENVFYKTSQNDSGKTGLLGEPDYPLNLKYDYEVLSGWYLAPLLSYTLLPRTTLDSAAKVTVTSLIFQIRKNLNGPGASGWDWYVGPGYISYQIKGNGGTTVLNNGTSTSTFALPGKTSQIQKITTNFGGSYSFNRSRLALDLVSDNFFSNSKRNMNLMFSYLYELGGRL